MDAAHLHMEITNRREWAKSLYDICLDALARADVLPGQKNDPGEAGSYGVATALGALVKEFVWAQAERDHGIADGDTDLTATLYSVFLGHIPDEALGDQFYRSTRERYLG